jgi:hypothetical protein
MNNDRAGLSSAIQVLATTLGLGFKFLAWVNGLALLLLMACAVGIIDVDLGAPWLRLPITLFLAGLALATLGLLWSYPVQASLLNQLAEGRPRRGHWIPLICVMTAYGLSLLAFVIACWLTLGMASFMYQNAGNPHSFGEGAAPSDQWAPHEQFLQDDELRHVDGGWTTDSDGRDAVVFLPGRYILLANVDAGR